MLVIQEKYANVKGARFKKYKEFKDDQADECVAELEYLRSLSKHFIYRIIAK